MSYDREKRAKRRKRNLVAKELRTNKTFVPKVIENKKPKRIRLRPEDISDDEVYSNWSQSLQDQDETREYKVPRSDRE